MMELRKQYSWIKFIEQTIQEKQLDDPKAVKELLVDAKREVRRHVNRLVDNDRRIIKQDWDYYIMRINLPSWIKTKEEAEEWFERNEFIDYIPRDYDCTGQLFTSWHRLFKVNDLWICYHCVSMDV